MAAKSIPAPSIPDILFIKPSNIFVVALPKILGPTIEKAALPIANNITNIIDTLYLDIYESNFFIVPLKSDAFSPAALIPLPIGPLLGLLFLLMFQLLL